MPGVLWVPAHGAFGDVGWECNISVNNNTERHFLATGDILDPLSALLTFLKENNLARCVLLLPFLHVRKPRLGLVLEARSSAVVRPKLSL